MLDLTNYKDCLIEFNSKRNLYIVYCRGMTLGYFESVLAAKNYLDSLV